MPSVARNVGMDYCSSCMRHTNGAISCPGCGEPAGAIETSLLPVPTATRGSDWTLPDAGGEEELRIVGGAPDIPSRPASGQRRTAAQYAVGLAAAAVLIAVTIVAPKDENSASRGEAPDRGTVRVVDEPVPKVSSRESSDPGAFPEQSSPSASVQGSGAPSNRPTEDRRALHEAPPPLVTPDGSVYLTESPAPPFAPLPSPATDPTAPIPSRPPSSISGSPSPSRDPVLLSRGMPVSNSSSAGAAYRPEAAVDGSTTTRWSSAWSDPQWIQVDLGRTSDIQRVELNWENYATDYQIQVSENGAMWQTLCSVSSGSGGERCEVPGRGRFVRMYGTARENGYGYSLWEFEIFGHRL
ncbi:discoidin domain-containing protein [Streptomyces zaomyceticus]|uniref:discoidin domain-containing protein n=1 Tax=Streptomyces zaomyceticus TaxID=68286 RepID=UPI0036CE99CE